MILPVGCVLALAWVSPALVRSQQSAVIQYLTNEPVSMLEWGLARLEERAQTMPYNKSEQEALFGREARVRYEPNQLNVNVRVWQRHSAVTRTPARRMCEALMRQIKTLLQIRGYDVGYFFQRRAKAGTEAPESLSSDLAALTRVTVEVNFGPKDEPPFSDVTCSSQLLKPEVQYVDNSPRK
jgi:hypothetical protein